MSAIENYRPQGNTILIAGTTNASAAYQVSSGNASGMRIYADAACFVAIGSSTVSAVIPTTAASANGIPLAANSPESFGCAPGAYISVITGSGTANVYATPGEGV